MNKQILNPKRLSNLLWLDFILGCSTGVLGLSLHPFLAKHFGLPADFIIWISAITLSYAIFAFVLVVQKIASANAVFILVCANWFWALLSCYFVVIHWDLAHVLGQIFLLLQILVVGGLAYFEGKQLKNKGSLAE